MSEVIGYTPIFKPLDGQLVTQCIINCSECGSMISGTMGPRIGSKCIKCTHGECIKILATYHPRPLV